MNWIYVDRDTYEVKFGTRPYAQPNYTGPFDCTRQDKRLTFAGWEGFFVVKTGDFWSLYFDVEKDRLQSKLEEGALALEVSLLRVEMPVKPVKTEEKEEEEAGGQDAPQEAKAAGQEARDPGHEGYNSIQDGSHSSNPAGGPWVELDSPEVD